MAANEMAGFKIKFLYFPPSLTLSLSLSHTHTHTHKVFSFSVFLSLWFFLCVLPFFPNDCRSSMKSISHLGTGWHWHVGRAIWRIMTKLYCTISPEWQSSLSSQLPYLLDVFMNSDWGVFQRLILFFALLFSLSENQCVYPGYWPWPMILCVPQRFHFHCKTVT